MVNDEGPVDNIVNAFRFGFSNVVSLAIWGIAFFVAIVIMAVMLMIALLAFYENAPMVIVLFLLSYLPIIAVGIPFLGFASQCLKTVIGGGSEMPTGLQSPGELVKDGVMTFIIMLEGFVFEMLCFVPGLLLIFLARSNDTLILAGLVLIMLAIPVMLIIYLLNVIQWAVYADTGSLMQGLNPLRPIGIILSNPGGAAIAGLSIIVAYVIFTIIMFICEMLIITILLMPFLMVAMYACIIYLVAVFYRQSRGDRFDTRDAMTAGYSVS
jgi:hypothetical protein